MEKGGQFIMMKYVENFFNLSKISTVFMLCLLTKNSLAGDHIKPVVDLYRSNQASIDVIKKKYQQEFQTIADVLATPDKMTLETNNQLLTNAVTNIITGVNKMGKFSYVNLSPTMYPGDKTIYITIDIVDEKDKDRLSHFLAKPSATIADPEHLIHDWLTYEKIGFSVVFKKNNKPIIKTCPAYHCIFGFDYPALEKYKNVFNTLVPKNKNQLIAVLRNDKDEHKRAAAAFLLSHIKDGNELIKILLPSISDSSSAVRNNVMRVLGATLAKMKSADFPINEAIKALDFPMATDRNKALYMIISLTEQPRYADYMRTHAGSALITQLKLSQPNVHDLAYFVLKKISGKNYAERDYASWEQWFKTNNQKIDGV